MAVEVVEVTSSRGGQDATDRSSRAELVYSVSGTDDLAAARSAVLATVPLAFDGLVYKSLSREYLGNGLWEFTTSYVEPDKADTNNKIDTDEYVFSFDTSGGASHERQVGEQRPTPNPARRLPTSRTPSTSSTATFAAWTSRFRR